MSVKFGYASEKTNSFRPAPWHWSTDPFPAYRGKGARHHGFLAVARYQPAFLDAAPSADGYSCPRMGFDPTATKLIRTKERNTLLLVTCPPEQDEQTMLITLRGGFRGGYSRIEAKGGEILICTDSNVHCCPTAHLIVRLTHPNGYVFAETGRRSSTGLVEIFSWDGYKTMPTEEFEAWQASQSPDLTDATKANAKAKAEAARKAAVVRACEQVLTAEITAKAETARKADAERMRPLFESRLITLSGRREAVGLSPIVRRDCEWYFGGGCSQQYTEEAVARAEAEVTEAETKHAEKKAFRVAVEALKSRMNALALIFYDHIETFMAQKRGECPQYFPYTAAGADLLREFVEEIETKVAAAKSASVSSREQH